MEKEATKLYDLIDCQNHEAVLAEIKTIISLLDSDRITDQFIAVYHEVVRLFDGFDDRKNLKKYFHEFRVKMFAGVRLNHLKRSLFTP